MKKIPTLLFMAAGLSCTACHTTQELHADNEEQSSDNAAEWADSVAVYQQQLLLADSASFMKLARCYHEGKGTAPSAFLMLGTLAGAEKHGFTNISDFIAHLPADDHARLLFEALNAISEISPMP